MPTVLYVHVDEPYRVRLAEAPIPAPGPGEVLLAARRSLISTGSELRRYRRYEGYDAFTYPVTDLGYSMVGEVRTVGEGLSVEPGTRYVAVQRHATHVVTPVDIDATRTAVAVPDGLGDDEATFGPLLRSTLNWLNNAAVDVHDTVVVLGQGLVGALLLQAVRLHTPRRVFVTDGFPLRLELALELGADEAVNVGAGDPVAAIREMSGGGADVVIDTVGGSHTESFRQALQMTRPGGRVVLVGMHTAPLTVDNADLMQRTVIGGNVGYDRRARVMRRGLELAAEGRFRLAPLITHRFRAEDVAEAFRLLDERPSEALGVVLEWV